MKTVRLLIILAAMLALFLIEPKDKPAPIDSERATRVQQ